MSEINGKIANTATQMQLVPNLDTDHKGHKDRKVNPTFSPEHGSFVE
jgi:hypothetical protein